MTTVAWSLSFDTGNVMFATFTPENDAMATTALEVAYVQRFPTDPIGSCSVTLSGVNAGSEIHVYLPDGTEIAGVESCVENQTLVWSVYPVGSANNTVQITIIKRGLRWQKFSYVSTVGDSSIPIFPQPDLGYNNPA